MQPALSDKGKWWTMPTCRVLLWTFKLPTPQQGDGRCKKDTVCTREQSPSRQELRHDAPDRPNVHWNTSTGHTHTHTHMKYPSPKTMYKSSAEKQNKLKTAAFMYRSCCSASSSAWSPGLGTTAWPHSPSFRHRCASPNQSPESEEQATGTGSHLGPPTAERAPCN